MCWMIGCLSYIISTPLSDDYEWDQSLVNEKK